MTAKVGTEREQKKTTNQQSLKGALAGVLAKSTQDTPQVARTESVEMPKPAAAEPPRDRAPESPSAKAPFEVPEDELRKVLKGDA